MFQSGAVCEPLKGVEFGSGAVPFRGDEEGSELVCNLLFRGKESERVVFERITAKPRGRDPMTTLKTSVKSG